MVQVWGLAVMFGKVPATHSVQTPFAIMYPAVVLQFVHEPVELHTRQLEGQLEQMAGREVEFTYFAPLQRIQEVDVELESP